MDKEHKQLSYMMTDIVLFIKTKYDELPPYKQEEFRKRLAKVLEVE